MNESSDQFDFQISQYLDGAMTPAERAEFEKQIAADTRLRENLAQYRNLDAALRSAAPLPELPWDQITAQLTSAVAQLPQPVQSYKLFGRLSGAWIGAAAMAACLFLALTAWRIKSSEKPAAVPVAVAPEPAIAIAMVTGPQEESAQGDQSTDVQLGAAPDSSAAISDSSLSIVAEPSHVYIGSATLVQEPARH